MSSYNYSDEYSIRCDKCHGPIVALDVNREYEYICMWCAKNFTIGELDARS